VLDGSSRHGNARTWLNSVRLGDKPTQMASEAEILSFFCRHLIGIGWYEGPVDEKGEFTAEPIFFGASGFLLQPHESIATYSLVTAGHVLRDHDERMRKPNMATRQPSLFDIWGPHSKCNERIPFDLFYAPALGDYDKEAGIDFAVVALPDLVLRVLGQTTIPFTKGNWIHQSNITFDFFAMLGLPNEEAEQIRSRIDGIESITTFQNPILLFVEPCELPATITPSTEPQFVARIDSRVDIESIVGMSGGPILGFRKNADGQLAYWPVAIQSRWLPDRRIVIGSFLPPLAARIEEWIDRFIEENVA